MPTPQPAQAGTLYGKMRRTMNSSRLLRKVTLFRLTGFVWAVFRYVTIIGLGYLILHPLLLMLSSAFMHASDLSDSTVVWIPKTFTLDNFKAALYFMHYKEAFFNSLFLAVSTTLLHVCTCTFVGYGFARFRFRGRNVLFALVLLTLIVPPQALMIPTFLHFRFFDFFGVIEMLTGKPGLNLLDTFWPFLLLSATGMGYKNGLYILIMRQFFRGLPGELEEAALVDGAGVFRTFYRIMLPNAVPAIVTILLFSFVWQWNDYFFVNLFLENMKVLPLTLDSMATNISTTIGYPLDPFRQSMINNTGSLLVILPLVILYLFAQRYFIEGIERSGLVG